MSALFLLALAIARLAEAQAPAHMVRDINSHPAFVVSPPSGFVPSGGTIFFSAENSQTGRELWRTDGTPGGTRLVRDIRHGPASSNPVLLTAVGDIVVFEAEATSNGPSLWTSDGTEQGTRGFASFNPITATRATSLGPVLGDRLFVKGVVDGVAALWAVNPASRSAEPIWIHQPAAELTNVRGPILLGEQIYFAAPTSSSTWQLWRSDGTANGTAPIAAFEAQRVAELIAVGDTLFLILGGRELWTSDGTSEGTHRIAFLDDVPDEIAAATTYLYYSISGLLVSGLWRSDGTKDGTILLRDTPWYELPRNFTTFGDRLFFRENQARLGVTDGNVSDTRILHEQAAGVGLSPWNVVGLNGTYFFPGRDDEHGYELWATDGTLEGTDIFADLTEGPADSNPGALATIGGALYFDTYAVADAKLWTSDGTPPGTKPILEFAARTASSLPLELTRLGDVVIFHADDGLAGREVWRTDGTEEGTWRVKDIRPGPEDSIEGDPVYFFRTAKFTALHNRLYFVANDGTHGYELWSTDGTENGTMLVQDLRLGPSSSQPSDLLAAGGWLYLFATDNAQSTQLWRTDGSPGGAALLKTFEPFTVIDSLVAANDKVFFVAYRASQPTQSSQIWKTDGTAEGTGLLTELALTAPTNLISFGDVFYFTAGSVVWATDGNALRTVATLSAGVGEPHRVGDQLVLSSTSALHWIDPPSGLVDVIDVPGPPLQAQVVEDALYFPLYNELWRSDGTQAGTSRIKSLAAPGPPGLITPAPGGFVFGACTYALGCEPYESDGTPEGTRLLADVGPGEATSTPHDFVVLGSNLLFATLDQGNPLMRVTIDGELWALPLDALHRCGDGLLDDGEECDSAGDPTSCEIDCTLPACGDGVINPAVGEQCDRGQPGGGCSANCQVVPGYDCVGEPSFCTPPTQTPTASPTYTVTPTVTPTRTPRPPTRTRTPTAPPCAGDCNEDRILSELDLRLAFAALFADDPGICRAKTGSTLRAHDLLRLIRQAQTGCPSAG